jgi:hypothetical protein
LIRRIIQPKGHSCADPRPSPPFGSRLTLSDRFYNADAPPQVTQEGEMIEFLAEMPTDTMIFLTMAVLSLPAMLIVLRRLI